MSQRTQRHDQMNVNTYVYVYANVFTSSSVHRCCSKIYIAIWMFENDFHDDFEKFEMLMER